MTFISLALFFLVLIIIYQISKANEFAASIRGEKASFFKTNRIMAGSLVAFFLLGMYGIWKCHQYMKPMLLPVSASVEGANYDKMFLVTTIVTGIVFVITQALLFWFSWKYQSKENSKALFFSHSNKLELIWTTIPAIVMFVLVAIGLRHWFNVTSEAPSNAQVIEVIGKQFNWIMRYPGNDGVLGKRNYLNINDADNILGMDRKDKFNQDDIISQNGEMHVVKGIPVKLIIGSRDVIHDVGLPFFRIKMDAVPGITSALWFTPSVSTDSMKIITGNPNFVYELACDQMCGKGHYSMRGTIVIHETKAELQAWFDKQKPYLAADAPAVPAAMAADSTKKVATHK